MKQSQLQDKLQLVRWQSQPKKHYPLLTINSLLLEHNPQFQQLKQIIHKYNQQNNPQRIKLQQKYIQQLFQMMNQLVRLPTQQLMLQYLANIWKWAHREPEKNRPTTATTRNKTQSTHSRPFSGHTQHRPTSAYTQARPNSGYRPTSGQATNQAGQYQRCISGHINNRPTSGYTHIPVASQELDTIDSKMNKTNNKIDYSKLKEGEKQFYAGIRTIHKEYEHPKKLLKDYQRKIFYQEPDDSDVEIIELEPQPQPLPEIELAAEIVEPEEEEGEGEAEGDDEAVNIDDIPIEGEEPAEAGEAEEEEPKEEVVDKLKPKIKGYVASKHINQYNHHNFQEGTAISQAMKMYKERNNNQDQELAFMQKKQAQTKGRVKSEQQRRAQSARILTKIMGIPVKQPKQEGSQNVINLDNVNPTQVNSKGWRPSTAFVANNPVKRQQLINKAFIAGKIQGHVKDYQQPTSQSIPSQFNIVGTSLAVEAPKPKKKTFEEILREAQERVLEEAKEQVIEVKETLVKNKIGVNANKILKSITYYEKQLEGDNFVGPISGLNMPSNPDFKVGKKKKKKKKRA